MSWLFGPSKPKPKLSADGTPEAPSRNDRQHCWDARDGFFECLNRHNIIDSINQDAEARKNCADEHRTFEQNCAATWVEYFKKRRIMEHKRAAVIARLEGEGRTSV